MPPSGTNDPQSGRVKVCSIWRALDVVGDQPTLVVLESIWLGISRFNGIAARTGLRRGLLSDRLIALCDAQLLSKGAVSEDARGHAYQLTQRGLDLLPTVMMLYRWERLWGMGMQRHAVEVTHTSCGARLDPVILCGHCRSIVEVDEVERQDTAAMEWQPINYTRRRKKDAFATEQPALFTGSVLVLGDRASALVLRAIFSDINRFDAILNDSGLTPNTLSKRLGELVTMGFLEKKAYQHNPVRHEYALTPKAQDYYSVMLTLMQWGDRHFPAPKGIPTLVYHRTCGAILEAKLGCKHCREEVTPETIRIHKI